LALSQDTRASQLRGGGFAAGGLHPLPKAIGPGLTARPNKQDPIVFVRPKVLQEGTSYTLGSGWVAGPNILGSCCATIPNDIIICIINIIKIIYY